MIELWKSITVAAVIAAATPILPASAAEKGSVPEGVTAYTVQADFEDVRFGLENAIVNRGLVIDYTSHIGEMLERTSADVGGTKKIFSNAQAMLFCSADLSRKAMEANPANIAYCPYTLFVYDTPDAEGSVTVGFRRLSETGSEASKAAIGEVNALLESIAQEAVSE